MSASINFPTPTQLKNLQDPTENADAVTKGYLDSNVSNITSFASNNYTLKTGDTITGIINITSTQQSVSNSTGALIVNGGVGISGNLNSTQIYSSAIYSNNYYGIIDAGSF
jgi:hypothetical protein